MIYFIEKTSNNDFKFTSLEGELIIDIHKLNEKIYKLNEKDLIIHDMVDKGDTVCPSFTVFEFFGCDWNSFNLNYSYNLFISSEYIFDKFNSKINYKEMIINSLKNQSYFGENSMFEGYTIDLKLFYNFLKIQNFPSNKEIKKIKLSNIDASYSSKEDASKFMYTLRTYEGFVVCSLLESTDIHLDSLNIMSHNNQLIIPFNLFTYLTKYKTITDINIDEVYITTRQKFKTKKENNFLNFSNISQKQNYLIELYTRYYFLIFCLEFFPEEMLAVDLKKKSIYTYDPEIDHPYFKYIKEK